MHPDTCSVRAEQPHAQHRWGTIKWPKALTQGMHSAATSFGSATATSTAAMSQALALTVALSDTMGFIVTWKSKMRLQKHPPKGKAVL